MSATVEIQINRWSVLGPTDRRQGGVLLTGGTCTRQELGHSDVANYLSKYAQRLVPSEFVTRMAEKMLSQSD